MTKNRIILLAGFTSIFLACNNTPDQSANADHSDHAAHNEKSSREKDEKQMNPVTETMAKMMHDMHMAKPTGNNEIDFAVMMVEHHKGAVEMSKVEVDQGTNAEMKAFAQKVIDDQNEEITFMQDFISKASKAASTNSADFQKALNGSMAAMMNDKTPVYNNIDKDFAAQMIPHHQSAVDMAEAYLKFGHNAALVKLCRNIFDSQTKEISWLEGWLVKIK